MLHSERRRRLGKRACFQQVPCDGYDPDAPSKALASVGYTSRLCSTAAPMKDENSGCGANGRDFSSG